MISNRINGFFLFNLHDQDSVMPSKKTKNWNINLQGKIDIKAALIHNTQIRSSLFYRRNKDKSVQRRAKELSVNMTLRIKSCHVLQKKQNCHPQKSLPRPDIGTQWSFDRVLIQVKPIKNQLKHEKGRTADREESHETVGSDRESTQSGKIKRYRKINSRNLDNTDECRRRNRRTFGILRPKKRSCDKHTQYVASSQLEAEM